MTTDVTVEPEPAASAASEASEASAAEWVQWASNSAWQAALTVKDAVNERPEAAPTSEAALALLAALTRADDTLREARYEAVKGANAAGASWQAIGQALGMSRQAAQKFARGEPRKREHRWGALKGSPKR